MRDHRVDRIHCDFFFLAVFLDCFLLELETPPIITTVNCGPPVRPRSITDRVASSSDNMSISPGDARVGKMLASSAAGATFLILIQLASRIFTFASNQVVLRTLSPAVLGVAAQLELYQVSILYFSRESIRMAIQRQPWAETSPYNSKNGPHQGAKEAETPSTAMQPTASQSVVNVSYLSLALGIPSSLFFTILYRHLVSTEASQTPFFFPSVMVTGAASLLELGIEPFFAVVQQHMLYEKRAAVEMPAAFIKSFTICFAFLYTSRLGYDVGALPFALGHFSYSLALICGYSMFMLGGTKEAPFSFLLTRIETRYAWLARRHS